MDKVILENVFVIGAAAAAVAIGLLVLFLLPKRPKNAPPNVHLGLPLIGNFIEFGKNPVAFALKCLREYGTVYTVPMLHKNLTFLLGMEFSAVWLCFYNTTGSCIFVHNIIILGPEASTPFFKMGDEQMSQPEVYQFMTPVFGKGVIYDATPSKRYQQMQRAAQGLRKERLVSYVPKIEMETMTYLTNQWGKSGEACLLNSLSELIIMSATRCLHGDDVRETMFNDVARLFHDLDKGTEPLSFFFPYLPTPAHAKRDRARKEMVEIFSKVIERRRADTTVKPEDRTDLLQLFIDFKYRDGDCLTDDQIVGLLIALLFAGQHTSSVTATWTVMFLAHHPRCMKAVLDEQRTVLGGNMKKLLTFDDYSNMVYLQNCVKEALRMHPPLILLMRGCMVDVETTTADGKKYVIPKGDIVVTSPAAASRASAVQTNRSTPGASAGAEAATGEATHNSGYFSWKDCCFLIHRSKGGTGRVVGWRKFLVENSFTIELSFCSNGNNTEASLIKQYMGLSSFLIRHANTFNNNNNNHFGNSNDHNKQNGSQPQPQQQQQQQQIVHDLDNSEAVEELLTMINSVNQSRFSSWSAAASSNSNIANYRRGSRSSGREMAPQVLIDELRKLLQCCYNSNNCYHYTVQDYLNIGEHIGVAMYHYANLSAQNVEKMLGPVNKFNNVIPVAGAIKKDSAGNSDNAPISTASRSGGSSFAPNNPSIADGVEIREGHKVYIDNKNYQDGKRRNSTRNTRTQRSSSFSASSLFTGDDINDTSLEDRYAANMGNVSSEGEGTKSRSQSIGDSDNEASTTGTSLALGGVSSPTAGCKKNKKTAKKTESKRRGKRSEKLESTNIELIGSRMLDAPITSASVYAADAFRFAANKVFSSFPSLAQEQELGIDEHAGNGSGGMVCGGSGASLTTAPVNAMTDSSQMFPYEEVHRIAPYLPLRLQTEWKIRQALSITFDKDRNPNSSLNVSLDLEHEELENSGDGGGSDSEPSVDNVSLQKVLKCSKHTIKRNAKGKKSTKNKFAASMQSMMNKLKRKKHRDKHGDGGTDNTADETEDENKGGIAFNGGAPSSDARLATLLNNCAMGSARGSATGKSTSNNMPGGTKSQNHRYDDPPPNGAEKPPLFLHVKTLKLDGLPSYGDAIVPSFMPGKINSSPVTPAGRKSSFSSSALINNDSKQQTAMGFTGGNSSITGSEKMNDNLLHVLHSNRPASAKCSDSGSKKLLSASAVSGNYKLTRGNRYVPVKDATKSTADGALLPSSHTLSRRNQMQAPNSGAAQQATFGTTTLVYPATSSSAASSSNVGFGRPGSSRGMTTSQSMPDIGGGSAAEISGRQAVNNAVSNSALSRTESGIQQAAASAVAGRGERNNRVGGVSGRNNKEKLDQQDNKRVSETSRNASFGSVCGLQQSPQNQTMLHSSDMSRGPPEVAGPGNNVEQAELKQRENSLFQQQMSQQRALTSILSKPSSLSPHMAEYQQHQVAASIPMQRQSGSLGTSLPASTFQLNSTSTPMATAVSSGKMVLGNNGGRKESMLQHTSMRSPNNHGGVAGGTSPASMLQSTFCPASTQNVTSTKSTAIPAAALSSTTAAAFTSSGSGRVNGGALAYDFHTHHNNKINNGKVAPSVAAFASTGMMSNPSAALSPKMPHIANKLLSSGFAAADPTMVSPIRKKEAET